MRGRLGHWRFRSRARSSNRGWTSGAARRPTQRRRKGPFIVAPNAIRLRGEANTTPRWNRAGLTAADPHWAGEVSVSIRRGRSSGRLRTFGLVIGTSLAGGTGCAKRFFDYRKDRRLRYSPLVSTEGACKPVRNGGIDALI